MYKMYDDFKHTCVHHKLTSYTQGQQYICNDCRGFPCTVKPLLSRQHGTGGGARNLEMPITIVMYQHLSLNYMYHKVRPFKFNFLLVVPQMIK